MANEKAIKRALCRRLKQVKDLWFYCPSDKFISGIPDVLILYKGKFIAVELKDPDKPSSTHRKLQGYVRGLIIAAGGYAIESNNAEQALKYIEEVMNVNI